MERFLLDRHVYDDLIGARAFVEALVELRSRDAIGPLIETPDQRSGISAP
jgi:hypothetical protein